MDRSAHLPRPMSRDYKAATSKSKTSSGGSGSSLLLGILIGLVLGLGIALAVAWYMSKAPSPFSGRGKGAEPQALPTRPEAARTPAQDGQHTDDKQAAKATERPRFEFYDILRGNEGPATERDVKDAARRSAAEQAKEGFFLQAGAFQNAPDADNLKARIALLGVEASIQPTTIPDKGTWYRVRLGPYTKIEELNSVRDTLKQNGIDTTLIKVRETP